MQTVVRSLMLDGSHEAADWLDALLREKPVRIVSFQVVMDPMLHGCRVIAVVETIEQR